jgi:CRISPR-associated protein Csb1
VLSLAALRKLSFGGGDVEARTVLAALGLLAVVAAESRGHDLRSRCLLVPRQGGALRLEAVARDGGTRALQLDRDGARALYEQAVQKLPASLAFAVKAGETLVDLKPTPKLAHLVKESRRLAAAGAEIDE